MAKKDQQRSLGKVGRVEREQRYNRMITILVGSVVGLVLLLIIGGAVWQNVILPPQPVASINGEEITAGEFIEWTKFQRWNTIQQIMIMAQFQGNLSPDVVDQLDPELIGRASLDDMIDSTIIQQEAEKMGITVSEEEISQEIYASFDYFPNGTETPEPEFPTPFPTSTRSAFLNELMTLTPTATITPTVTPSTEPQEDEDNPEATATPFSLPSATPIIPEPTATIDNSLDGFEQRLDEYKELLDSSVGYQLKDETLHALIESSLYRLKMYDLITGDVPVIQDQVWVRHIMVANEEAATLVLDSLNNGEDWTTLVENNSLDERTSIRGGDLGWFPESDDQYGLFQAAATMEIGEITGPIEDADGNFHIIQLLGHEDRALSEFQHERIRNDMFEAWLEEKKAEAEIEEFDLWKQIAPDEPSI